MSKNRRGMGVYLYLCVLFPLNSFYIWNRTAGLFLLSSWSLSVLNNSLCISTSEERDQLTSGCMVYFAVHSSTVTSVLFSHFLFHTSTERGGKFCLYHSFLSLPIANYLPKRRRWSDWSELSSEHNMKAPNHKQSSASSSFAQMQHSLFCVWKSWGRHTLDMVHQPLLTFHSISDWGMKGMCEAYFSFLIHMTSRIKRFRVDSIDPKNGKG